MHDPEKYPFYTIDDIKEAGRFKFYVGSLLGFLFGVVITIGTLAYLGSQY